MADGDLSMLDKMASGIMERKEAAAARAKLTPVKGEKAKAPTVVDGLPVVPEATFPNDVPGEVVSSVIRELGRQIEHLTEARDALALLVGGAAPADQPGAGVETEAETKAREFAADFAAKQREAQEKTFTPLTVLPNMVADSTVEGGEDPDPPQAIADAAEADAIAAGLWVCPEHGTRQETKSRKGRDMVACGSYPSACQKFEMPA